MITIKIIIENEIYANLFAELVANFTFVKSVEIPQLTKSYMTFPGSEEELLVLPPREKGDPSKYCGIWAKKRITDIKQFRNNLWQRTK